MEELGIVGNRAIHEIASHNGWKDGSAEKVALHGMLGAITSAKSGGSVLSGLIAGGANEYAIEYLKQTKGKDWINKHPDTVQNISADISKNDKDEFRARLKQYFVVED